MKYRHSYHAGNFADVHKHVALRALLQALQRKDTGFLYVDTHAGAGRYHLGGADTHHGLEAKHGVTAFMAASSGTDNEALREYRAAIEAHRRPEGLASSYPGSPWLAAQALREQDRGLCCESLASECRALERALGGYRRVRIECADGYAQLRAALPPRERRALVLIDPPYETPAAELDQATQAIVTSLERLANVVIALWYPVKDERTLLPWLKRLERLIKAPTLSLELWLYPRDSHVALNGSGLLLVNPPFQFAHAASVWQAELLQLIDRNHHGGSSLRWIVGEADAQHGHA